MQPTPQAEGMWKRQQIKDEVDLTGSKGKGSIRERQVEMGAEECSFFFFFQRSGLLFCGDEGRGHRILSLGEREGWEEERKKAFRQGGGVLEAPAVTSENNGAGLCGQTTIPRSHFPSFSFIARRSSPILPPLINTSRVPVSGEQSGGNMRDETRACIRVFVCKMMSPTSISRCVVLGRWGVDFKSTCLRKVRNCVLVAFVPSKAGRPRISSQDLRWPHPLEIQKGGFNQCWVDTVWYNCYGTFCIIY